MTDLQHENHDQQPSARWCFVCGVENPVGLKIKFFNDGPHCVKATVTLGDEYQGYPGVAHGGILATILDETIGRAILSEEGPERFMFTASLEVRYRKTVPLNEAFTVIGRIETLKGRKATASGEIVLADGTVATEATSTLIAIPQDQIEQMKTEDIGWRVYP